MATSSDNLKAVVHLADQLSEGFLALVHEYSLLREQHQQLEEQLEYAKKQHLDILQAYTPSRAAEDHNVFLHKLSGAGFQISNGHPDWFEILSDNPTDDHTNRAYLIKQAELANEKLRDILEHPPENDAALVQTNGYEESYVNGQSLPTIETTTLPPDHSPLEQDFTTVGTPGKLGCPFSKMNGLATSMNGRHSPGLTPPRSSMSKISRRSKRPSFNDPIRAEVCGNDSHNPLSESEPPDIESGAAVCPIRFLDQHSPEEVAQYFENHKHELPRSHEVCVKRFQSNAEQIRQLDNKYGNLVSMIQGLGEKHQPMLPEDIVEGDEAVAEGEGEVELETDDKVKDWARAVSRESIHQDTADFANNQAADSIVIPTVEADAEDDREQHFDRPLKEIRVGESPSRPWGITVPAKYVEQASISSKRSSVPAVASPPLVVEAEPIEKPAVCPFDHRGMMGAGAPAMPTKVTQLQTSSSEPEKPVGNDRQPCGHATPPSIPPEPSDQGPGKQKGVTGTPQQQPQMVFTGPVFIGYAPEMIKQFMGQQ